MSAKSKTNPLGEGTANVSVNIPIELRQQLREAAAKEGKPISQYLREFVMSAVDNELLALAEKSNMSFNEYIGHILSRAKAKKTSFKLVEEVEEKSA